MSIEQIATITGPIMKFITEVIQTPLVFLLIFMFLKDKKVAYLAILVVTIFNIGSSVAIDAIIVLSIIYWVQEISGKQMFNDDQHFIKVLVKTQAIYLAVIYSIAAAGLFGLS